MAKDDELSLFGPGVGEAGSGTGREGEGAPSAPGTRRPGARGVEADAADAAAGLPLAARMRPRSLDGFVGQERLLGEGRALRAMLDSGTVSSLIFWGPPGSGKTTLARLLAEGTDAAFVSFSAVTEGVARVRQIIAEAAERLRATGRRTILFCDEIHRFNKAQQDAFLPHVEDGTIILIGATTENPSFEVVRPLLSRAPVFTLEPLAEEHLVRILEDALTDRERGLGELDLRWTEGALETIARNADGDARRALGILEGAAQLLSPGGEIDEETAGEATRLRFAHHDKGGEAHFNQLSAFHKSLRGSDPHAALYWMARLIEGGEDPMTLVRRAIAVAAEDVGLADPDALRIAVAARDAYHMLGPPEGYLPLAEMTIYLATAPKSNSVKRALDAARAAARETPAAEVPLHIRNAPTPLMKELGFHEGYRYAHDAPEGYLPQEYLPDVLRGSVLYEPGSRGYEEAIRRRLEAWAAIDRREEEG